MHYKNILPLPLLFLLLLTACSNIKYITPSSSAPHTDANLKNDIEAQASIIKKASPDSDSFWNHILGDNRLVTIMGVGEYVPGVDTEQKEYRQFGTKIIWGTTDNQSDYILETVAVIYAYQYNWNLLKLTGKENLKRDLNEREKVFTGKN